MKEMKEKVMMIPGKKMCANSSSSTKYKFLRLGQVEKYIGKQRDNVPGRE